MILTVINVVISFSLMLGGVLMKITANKPINETVGFRTHRAMLNVTNWHYANHACGTRWLLVGAAGFAANMLITFAALPNIRTKTGNLLLTLALAAQIIAAIITAACVEKKLKLFIDTHTLKGS